jgi:alpha-L-fucosidase
MSHTEEVPSYLRGYEAIYADDPRRAALRWFRDAGYGMFVHYGLYSLLGRHEWVQWREKIPVAEYARLADQFTAEGFDAGAIADLAVASGMRYLNITTEHHEGFCLGPTRQTDFHSVNAPAGRDLVGELAEACRDRELGLFFYYSHGRHWRHPHAPNRDEYDHHARPDYDPPEPSYAYGDEHDPDRYFDYVAAQVTELLTGYGPVAGIWLDGVNTALSGDTTVFRIDELYDLIHSLQPQVLISYKGGLNGNEDLLAPEHEFIDNPTGKPMEICTTMCPGSWGYDAPKAGRHLSAEPVWDKLVSCRRAGANLLLNTGPLPDGSIDPEDEAVFREVGRRIAREGMPEPEAATG